MGEPKGQGFLGKISESHGSGGQWVLPENCSYLNPTELLDLREPAIRGVL